MEEKLAPLAPPPAAPKPSLAAIQRQQQDEDEFSALASRGAPPRSAWGGEGGAWGEGGAQGEAYWERRSMEHAEDGWGGHEEYWRESVAPAPPEIRMLVRPASTPASQPPPRGEEEADPEEAAAARARKARQDTFQP